MKKKKRRGERGFNDRWLCLYLGRDGGARTGMSNDIDSKICWFWGKEYLNMACSEGAVVFWGEDAHRPVISKDMVEGAVGIPGEERDRER